VSDDRNVRSSSSLSCDAASESWDGGAVTDPTRERASATTLSYVGSELGCEIEVVELPRGAFVPLLLEGVGDRLMASESSMWRKCLTAS
jgi:hypothetical protein